MPVMPMGINAGERISVFRDQGKLTMKFEPEDGGEVFEYTVFDAPSEGIAWECIKDESIWGFARACLNYGLELCWPVFFLHKDTILK